VSFQASRKIHGKSGAGKEKGKSKKDKGKKTNEPRRTQRPLRKDQTG